ncbi:MAG: energy-coupling factor transporter ATPase [Anaerolineaceae bacterium]|nr:energy-coupling factor transporter ATPase [Anaerolineaceae bacterium]
MAQFFEVNNLSYAHHVPGGEAQPALSNVSFSIPTGQYTAIVGSNGSGKTTLARHLNALHIPDSGTVLVQGLNTKDKSNHLLIHQQVGMVFQHPQEQMVATTIEEDVAFGPENLGLPTVEIHDRVKQALDIVGLWDIRERSPQHLSAGQMQRVALAGILAMRPDCVIFDEATAMLDPIGRQDIYKNIQYLKNQGITVITITHFMSEVVHAEKVIALHSGKLVFEGTPVELFANSQLLSEIHLTTPPVLTIANRLKPWIPILNHPLTEAEFEQQIQNYKPSRSFPLPIQTKQAAEPALIEASDLSFTYLANTPLSHQALKDISFSIPDHSLFGLIGSTGSGKSTLLQHLNGLYQAQSGTLRVGPYEVNEELDVQLLRQYVGIVFQNPNYQLFEQYVGDEIAYGLKLRGLFGSDLRQRVQIAMNNVGLDFETFKDRLTFTLSGGERRKVALASTIALDPQVLLLDEPTAGLDPYSRIEVRGQIQKLYQSGKTIVLSSHQMEDMAKLSQNILLLNKGKKITQQSTSSLLSDQHLLNQYQMKRPIAAKLAQILRSLGWNLPEGIITTDQLIEQFALSSGVNHG